MGDNSKYKLSCRFKYHLKYIAYHGGDLYREKKPCRKFNQLWLNSQFQWNMWLRKTCLDYHVLRLFYFVWEWLNSQSIRIFNNPFQIIITFVLPSDAFIQVSMSTHVLHGFLSGSTNFSLKDDILGTFGLCKEFNKTCRSIPLHLFNVTRLRN